MNKITAIKFGARLIVGLGTTTISNSIIRNNVTPSNPLEQISTVVASFVIGSMASEATRAHTEEQIDKFVAAVRKNKSTEPTPA